MQKCQAFTKLFRIYPDFFITAFAHRLQSNKFLYKYRFLAHQLFMMTTLFNQATRLCFELSLNLKESKLAQKSLTNQAKDQIQNCHHDCSTKPTFLVVQIFKALAAFSATKELVSFLKFEVGLCQQSVLQNRTWENLYRIAP